jgi:hypothetical protein
MALAGTHLRVLTGQYELTGDLNQITIQEARLLYDVTAFGDSTHHYLKGIRKAEVDHVGYLNTDAGRSHPVLHSGQFKGHVSVLVGQNRAPQVGDPAYTLTTQQGKYTSFSEVAKHIPFGASFAASSGNAGGWGVLVADLTPITADSFGSILDLGQAPAVSATAYVHILEPSTLPCGIYLQGSASGTFSGEEYQLLSTPFDGTVSGSFVRLTAFSLPRYVRYQVYAPLGIGGTLRFALNLVR